MKKRYKVLIITTVIIITGLSVYFYVFMKPHKNTFDLQAEYNVSANKLFTEFETDESNANSKYLGKIIQIEGKIIKIKNISNSFEVSFIDEIFGVTCVIDSVYAIQQKDELKELKIGNNVKIKGQCNGYLADVKLDRCIIVSEH